MNLIFRSLLSFSSIMWIIIPFIFNHSNNDAWNEVLLLGGLVGYIQFLITSLCIILSSKFPKDSIEKCKNIDLKDGELLPVYLAYLFVGLSINNHLTMFVMLIIIFVFCSKNQAYYFNPIFILMGYHFYALETERGTKIYVILKRKVIRNINDIDFPSLRRMNDTTFIERE